MSVNYSNLFTSVGRCVHAINAKETLETTTLPAEVVAIASAVGTAATSFGEAQLPLEGLDNAYQGYGQAVTGIRQSIATFVTALLTDQDTIVSQIPGLVTNDISTCLAAIQQDMVDNGQSINASVATLGSVTPVSGNVGNGTVLLDKILDGTTPPGINFPASPTYLNKASELVVPTETMQLTCVADSYGGQTSEGAEQFSWIGATPYQAFDWHPDGSGSGPTLTVANGNSIGSNLNFTNWSGGKPSGWTVTSGTTGGGGTIQQDTTNVFRTGSALRFNGNGGLAQSIAVGQIQPRTRYCITVQLRKIAGATGQVQIFFSGTGYSPGSESITVSASTLTTSYQLFSAFWTTPATLPSDLKLNITGTGGVSGGILVDSMSLDANIYHGGIAARVIAGSTPFATGDRLRFSVSNNEGIFQKFFRRAYGVQLPSTMAISSPPYFILLPYTLFPGTTTASTISDTLAT